MIRIGVLCPADIAFRRFMPALMKCNDKFVFSGIAVASEDEWGGNSDCDDSVLRAESQKARKFIDSYGGKLYNSYSSLIESAEIDAVYLPLPPGLHFAWGKRVLEAGKNLFMEKPFTTAYKDSFELITLAKSRNLVVHENYMFMYHFQIEYIKKILQDKQLGTTRLIRIDFGFPFRGANDFRYSKELGGGALLDCGGYTVRLAAELLGSSAMLISSNLSYSEEFDVDIFGTATLRNRDGLTANVSFGMDNTYRCSLDIWGSEASLFTNRVFTAPAGYKPDFVLTRKDCQSNIQLPEDDTFKKSLLHFHEKIESGISGSDQILSQAKLVQQIYDAKRWKS